MSPTVLSGRPPAARTRSCSAARCCASSACGSASASPSATPAGERAMLITGSAVFPYFGQGSFTPTDVGKGAEITAAVLAPQARRVERRRRVQLRPGKVRARAGAGRPTSRCSSARGPVLRTIEQATCLVTDQRPNTVNNYAAIDATPAVLAAVLALLGLGVLAQFTVASARRSRRDFAILKVLGMTPPRPEGGFLLPGRHGRPSRAWPSGSLSASSAATGPGSSSRARRAFRPMPSHRSRSCG